MEKAFNFVEAGSMVSFDAVLALLIYGLVLFPSIPSYVDINTIRIFLIGNSIPTMLGDTYFSIHHRIVKEMELSCVVYLCNSNGLSRTCLSLLSSTKTKRVG